MIIGIFKEKNDPRVALIPETIQKFKKLDVEVWIESGAGSNATYSDDDYTAKEAKVAKRAEMLKACDIVVSISPLSQTDLSKLSAERIVLSQFNPLVEVDAVAKAKELSHTYFSLDRIPRTTLAQSMDILSSMASLAGYKAVLVGANHLPGYMPMLMTAAGTIPPAQVLVLGAGVAGLQAIATARRLGGRVSAFDVRSAVREEVESLGATFIEVEGAAEDIAAGGYAVIQSDAYQKKQKELIDLQAQKSDIIISTAQIPGKKAPVLMDEKTVKGMKTGSVIVDLASASGGNCTLTENDKVVQKHGITIVGDSNLSASMAKDASKLYSNNVFNFCNHLLKNGKENIDWEDEIVKGSRL